MPTLGDFRTRITNRLGLDSTSGGTELSLADSWINEGVIEVLLRTRCKVVFASVALTANEDDYTLDTAILSITEMYHDSAQDRMLERVTPEEILRRRIQSATNYTDDPRYYALNGADLLMLYPTPASSSTIVMFYIPRPTVLSQSTHDPSAASFGGIPSEYHKAIEYFALWQGADYIDDGSSKIGDAYKKAFEEEIRNRRNSMRLRGGRLLPRKKVSPLKFPSTRNDVY